MAAKKVKPVREASAKRQPAYGLDEEELAAALQELRDKQMSADEFEQATIDAALGDPANGRKPEAEAGRDALRMCAERLEMGTLSPRMARYLADRLHEVVAGVPPLKALRIARLAVKPRDTFPEWKMPLAAFAALMARRGCGAEDIIARMDEARQLIEDKALSRTQAQLIRTDSAAMRAIDGDLLRHLMLYRQGPTDHPRGVGSTVPRFAAGVAKKLLAMLDRKD